MQNPNTADEFFLDPASKICMEFFTSIPGIGSFEIVNVDPRIAANHSELDCGDLDKENNLTAILSAIANCDIGVAAWGEFGGKLMRDEYFDLILLALEKVKSRGGPIMCFGITKKAKEPIYPSPKYKTTTPKQLRERFTDFNLEEYMVRKEIRST